MTYSLVTGGAGFIGAHVSKHLADMGHHVVVLDDLSGGFKENVDSRVTFIEGSINDHKLLEKLFDQYKFDYVYHLAAYAAEGLSHFIRRFNYTNNLIGSVNLINEAIKHNVKCFVFTSSIAVYGTNQLPMQESLTPSPEDPYGIAKLAVELDLKAAHDIFGMNYIIFRPHNVYGEYQNIGDRYRNVIGIFMNQIKKQLPLTVFGNGEQTRAFSYIDDVAPHIARSVEIQEAYNRVFNIGGDLKHTINNLIKTIQEVLNIDCEIKYVEERNEVAHAYCDHSKVNKVFNINPSTYVSLRDGISKTLEWVEKQKFKKAPKFENIEVMKMLPPVWLED